MLGGTGMKLPAHENAKRRHKKVDKEVFGRVEVKCGGAD